MKKYITRSVKYLVALCVIYVAVMALMFATGSAALSPSDTIYVMTHSWRGAMMIVAILVLAATYPMFGFVRRSMSGDLKRSREQIVATFATAGFALVGQSDDSLTFRAAGTFKRIAMLYEDTITVSQSGASIVVDGNRRGVAQVDYRLRAMYVENE